MDNFEDYLNKSKVDGIDSIYSSNLENVFFDNFEAINNYVNETILIKNERNQHAQMLSETFNDSSLPSNTTSLESLFSSVDMPARNFDPDGSLNLCQSIFPLEIFNNPSTSALETTDIDSVYFEQIISKSQENIIQNITDTSPTMPSLRPISKTSNSHELWDFNS
ncbi:hypothetical protein HZS_55, partial [Henneguya salminicola]